MSYSQNAELFNGYTCLLPASLAYYFFNLTYSSFGLILHCPFRMIYHVHNSVNDDIFMEEFLYKISTIVLYINLFLIGYEWEKKFNTIEFLFYILASIYVYKSNPMHKNKHKQRVDLYTAIGILKSTGYMAQVNSYVYLLSVFFGFYASMHYIDDEGSPYARGKVNILALPAYYGLLWSVKQNNILANN